MGTSDTLFSITSQRRHSDVTAASSVAHYITQRHISTRHSFDSWRSTETWLKLSLVPIKMTSLCLVLSAICIFVSMYQVSSFSSSVRSFPRQINSQLYMAGFGAKKDVVDSAKTTARVADANAPCKFSTLLDSM